MALTDKLTAIGEAIRAETKGTDLIPLVDMPPKISGAFADLRDKLDSLIEGSITEVESDVLQIRAYVFRDSRSLTRASFPNLEGIPSNAFALCYQLANIQIPSATAIEGTAFYRCEALKTLNLPAVKSISGTQAFFRCEALDTLILRAPELCTLSSANSFERTLIESGTGYIYVPAALLEEYKTATNWVVYANQIRAIEDYPEICQV